MRRTLSLGSSSSDAESVGECSVDDSTSCASSSSPPLTTDAPSEPACASREISVLRPTSSVLFCMGIDPRRTSAKLRTSLLRFTIVPVGICRPAFGVKWADGAVTSDSLDGGSLLMRVNGLPAVTVGSASVNTVTVGVDAVQSKVS